MGLSGYDFKTQAFVYNLVFNPITAELFLSYIGWGGMGVFNPIPLILALRLDKIR